MFFYKTAPAAIFFLRRRRFFFFAAAARRRNSHRNSRSPPPPFPPPFPLAAAKFRRPFPPSFPAAAARFSPTFLPLFPPTSPPNPAPHAVIPAQAGIQNVNYGRGDKSGRDVNFGRGASRAEIYFGTHMRAIYCPSPKSGQIIRGTHAAINCGSMRAEINFGTRKKNLLLCRHSLSSPRRHSRVGGNPKC